MRASRERAKATREQIEEERRNYWKRERQAAFAKALDTYYESRLLAGRIHSSLREYNHENAARIDEYIDNFRKVQRQFVKTRSVIDLLATEKTVEKVDEVIGAMAHLTRQRSEWAGGGATDPERFGVYHQLLTYAGRFMVVAFRHDLGIPLVELDPELVRQLKESVDRANRRSDERANRRSDELTRNPYQQKSK